MRGDPYETTDAVFGVKQSLIVDLERVDAATAREYDVPEGIWLLRHDFVLVTEAETAALRVSLALGVTYLVMMIVGLAIVDKVGRRRLTLIMVPGAALALARRGISLS